MEHLPAGLLLVKFDVFRKLRRPWFVAPHEMNGERDDVYFCRRATEAGYEIWCDHDLTQQVIHKGEQDIPWFSQEKIIRVTGAQMKSQKDAEREIAA